MYRRRQKSSERGSNGLQVGVILALNDLARVRSASNADDKLLGPSRCRGKVVVGYYLFFLPSHRTDQSRLITPRGRALLDNMRWNAKRAAGWLKGAESAWEQGQLQK